MGIPALTITSPTTPGKMLVESAIFFEASAAGTGLVNRGF